MSGFQNGDHRIKIGDQTYHLRLSIGALAEIAHGLSLSGPQGLAQRLRFLEPEDGRVLLACLMRPCLPSGDVRTPAAHFSDDQIAAVMPAICSIFETSFSPHD